MIRKENLEAMIKAIGYVASARSKVFEKKYAQYDCTIEVDFNGSGSINYPEDKGFKITRKTTCNFSEPENFVVLECITRLMDKGYRPEHIELEKEWTLGHEKKSGFADILVKDEEGKTLFIVECKTAGGEYKKELNNLQTDGGQLFSYWQQEGNCKWLSLYASDFDGTNVTYSTESIDCSDDANILTSVKKDSSILLYRDAHTIEDLFTVWDETYDKKLCGDVIFRDDSQAYQIGVKPLRKVDLKDFGQNDKVVNKFEEILRHNNVSDKENAFNRLIALFICKLVDEIQKGDNDIVDFQYKVGTDTYETLQDRLQRLHKEGMEKFMHEEIFYVPDDYAENLVQQYTGHKRQKMIEDLKKTLRILKFYTNNDFAFKDVHNEDLFYQNGRILVEVVQLFEHYRIISSNDVQMLGDLFEQLLNKGFKQNEGQFFTPIPITRFIWDSLPIDKIIKKGNGIEFPKMIDYACGAGHFLTQGFEAVNASVLAIDPTYTIDRRWAEHKIYGIEKDYRLARVSKISLFMHGAGDGNIIFGDGLENYPDKDITPGTFDILVANPPYAVKAFKPHLKLKDNNFTIIDKISNDGSEIETLFVERISQLVKPGGVVAVVLPVSILNKESESFVCARETILQNFKIRAITLLGSKTFGATGTNTVILFLEKYAEPPKRLDLVIDSINSIYELNDLTDWEDADILNIYLQKIKVDMPEYFSFVKCKHDYIYWKENEYFSIYYNAFVSSTEYSNKIKQKTFLKLSNDDKAAWLNEHFYDFAHSCEKEKLLYFALVYQQITLIVTAPDDNKAQESFLGYKWSNRKGQEGIQLLLSGGLLYTPDNRIDNNKIAGLIRNSFSDIDYLVEELSELYYYQNLGDMIDFSSISFTKSIKTAKIRPLKNASGLINYRLSDSNKFEVFIGNRVLSNEVNDDGSIPVYSANVFEVFGKINKKNIDDFSVPSIIWGIDGDWMVNILPANMVFYPTDHCGVLRLKTDEIIPEYLAIALSVAGEYEKFSRSNRASAQRIRNLLLQIPEDKLKQRSIVDKISNIDKDIQSKLSEIHQLDLEIQKIFSDTFGNLESDPNGWGYKTLEEVCDVRDGTHDSPKYIYDGGYPLLTSQNFTKGFVDMSNVNMISQSDFDAINKRSKVDKGDIVMPMIGTIGSPVIIDIDLPFAIKNVALIKFASSSMKPKYIQQILSSSYFFKMVEEANRGSNRKFLSLGDLRKLKILMAPTPLQNDFSRKVEKISGQKRAIQNQIVQLQTDKKAFIDKHFR